MFTFVAYHFEDCGETFCFDCVFQSDDETITTEMSEKYFNYPVTVEKTSIVKMSIKSVPHLVMEY